MFNIIFNFYKNNNKCYSVVNFFAFDKSKLVKNFRKYEIIRK